MAYWLERRHMTVLAQVFACVNHVAGSDGMNRPDQVMLHQHGRDGDAICVWQFGHVRLKTPAVIEKVPHKSLGAFREGKLNRTADQVAHIAVRRNIPEHVISISKPAGHRYSHRIE